MDLMHGSLNPSENSLSFLYNYAYHPSIADSEKKRRLTNEQIEFLEKSFLEDPKLEPERKSKLTQDLRLQPRQIAIWFQNRRARWKAKELQRSYDALKFEYDVVLQENKRLQEEVLALKTILREQTYMNHQVSSSHTELSGDHDQDQMGSTSMEKPSPTKLTLGETNHVIDQSMFGFNGHELSYWN